MIKKLIVKLVNWQAQRMNPKRFHPAQVIQEEKIKEHNREAMERRQEMIKDEGKKREEPSDSVILGPSGPEEA